MAPPFTQPLAVAVPLLAQTTLYGVNAKSISCVAFNCTYSKGLSVLAGLAMYPEITIAPACADFAEAECHTKSVRARTRREVNDFHFTQSDGFIGSTLSAGVQRVAGVSSTMTFGIPHDERRAISRRVIAQWAKIRTIDVKMTI